MNHYLTEQQLEVKQMIRDFAESEILPSVATRDESGDYPQEICQKLAELGFMGVTVPEKLGGAGMDAVTYAIVIEELSRVDPSIGLILAVNNSLVCYPLQKYGTPEQHKDWLQPLAEGKRLGAFCLNETDSGSDFATLRCTAVREANDYVLNGTKANVINGSHAHVYLLFARTNLNDIQTNSISAFLVPANSKGLRIGEPKRKMGVRSVDCVDIVLEGVRISAANLLGLESTGNDIATAAIDSGRIGISAQSVGLAQGALEAAVRYSKLRVQFNQPISNFQAIQRKLADMEMQIQAARLLVHSAALKMDAGLPFAHEAAIAKLFASDMVVKVTMDAVQIHGGAGYTRDFPVERMMRDAKATELDDDSAEIHQALIAQDLLATF